MEKVFVTPDLTLAMAMVAAGFTLRNAEKFVSASGTEGVSCELDDEHVGITARYMKSAHENAGVDLTARVNEIIAARGITHEEYVILAFDGALAGLKNRKRLQNILSKQKPLIAKDLGNNRTLIFREDVPESGLPSPQGVEEIRKLLNELDK